MKKKIVLTLFMLIFAMGIAGCGGAGSEDTPTATPEVTDTPTSTPTARPTSTPTFTPSPSPTPMPYTSADTLYPWLNYKYGCEKDIASIIYYDEQGKIIKENDSADVFALEKIPKYAACFNAEGQQICTVIYDYNCEDIAKLRSYKKLSTKEYDAITIMDDDMEYAYDERYLERLAVTCTYVEYDTKQGSESGTFKKYCYASMDYRDYFHATENCSEWLIKKFEIVDDEKLITFSHSLDDDETYEFYEEALVETLPEYYESVTGSEYGKQERPDTPADNVYFDNGTLIDKELDEKLDKLSSLAKHVEIYAMDYKKYAIEEDEDALCFNGIFALNGYSYSNYKYCNDVYAYVNLETGEKLTLADFFYKDVNYVELINNEINRYYRRFYSNLDSGSYIMYEEGNIDAIDADQPFYIKRVRWTDDNGNENVSLYLVILFTKSGGKLNSINDGFILDPAVFAANGSFNIINPANVFEAGTYEVKKVTYPAGLEPESDYGFVYRYNPWTQHTYFPDSEGFSFAEAKNVGDKYNFIFMTDKNTDTDSNIWRKYLIAQCQDTSSDLVTRLYQAFEGKVEQEAAETDDGGSHEATSRGENGFCWNGDCNIGYCDRILPCHKITEICENWTFVGYASEPIEYTYPLDIYVDVTVGTDVDGKRNISFNICIDPCHEAARSVKVTVTIDSQTYEVLSTDAFDEY